MNWSYIHLLINHIPVTGIALSALALMLAQRRRSDALRQFGLGTMAAMGLLAFIAHTTGEMAAEAGALSGLGAAVQHHAEVAKAAMIGCMVLGTAALWAMLYPKAPKAAPAPAIWALIAASIACVALLVWTASAGGDIRHGPVERIGDPAPMGATPPATTESSAQSSGQP